MNLSKELQIGKAGEHLVCCDLISQGISAFLADAGLPYDVLIDRGDGVKRVQVKTTTGKCNVGKVKNIYAFRLRWSKGNDKSVHAASLDYVAFVFLDKRIVQYLPVAKITNKHGHLKQCIHFRESDHVPSVFKKAKYIIGQHSTL